MSDVFKVCVFVTMAVLLSACGGPSVNESLSKDFTIHSPEKALSVPTEAVGGDGEGDAEVDFGGKDELKVMPYSARYVLDKTPRDSSDVQISFARLTVEQPVDADLESVHSVHIYLLPRDATWNDSSRWRRVAVGRGFEPGSRTMDLDILSKPSNVEQFIQHEDEGDEVWVGIYVVLEEDCELPEDGLEVTVDMDLEISL